jgi:hypothetical protein
LQAALWADAEGAEILCRMKRKVWISQKFSGDGHDICKFLLKNNFRLSTVDNKADGTAADAARGTRKQAPFCW